MKAYRLIFPFSTTKKIPDDIKERLSSHEFEPLKDSQFKSTGFALLTESERFINSDGRHLFHYVEQSRKANTTTVQQIYQERLQKISDEGREITVDTQAAVMAVAESEAAKFAAIKTTSVYIVFDGNAGRVWCAGGTPNKCEAALKRLRKALGSLDTEPVVLPVASRRLAQQLRNSGLRVHETLHIPDGAKVIAQDKENECRVTFDGISLLDAHVGDVLEDMIVRSTEMELHKAPPHDANQVLASFVLDVPEHSGMSLRALHFSGGSAEGGDSEHDHAAEMQIVAKTCQQILAGLTVFLTGEPC